MLVRLRPVCPRARVSRPASRVPGLGGLVERGGAPELGAAADGPEPEPERLLLRTGARPERSGALRSGALRSGARRSQPPAGRKQRGKLSWLTDAPGASLIVHKLLSQMIAVSRSKLFCSSSQVQ